MPFHVPLHIKEILLVGVRGVPIVRVFRQIVFLREKRTDTSQHTLSDDVRKNGAYPQIGRFYLDAGEAKYKKVYERLVIRNKHPEVPREAQ